MRLLLIGFTGGFVVGFLLALRADLLVDWIHRTVPDVGLRLRPRAEPDLRISTMPPDPERWRGMDVENAPTDEPMEMCAIVGTARIELVED